MKITVKAKPGARENSVEKIGEREYVVSVKAPAVDGKANEAIRKLLAEYFSVGKMSVVIASGHHARLKVLEIL